MPFEDLTTGRLLLRRLCSGDAERVYRYWSDPEVVRYQTWEPRELKEVRELLQRMSEIEPNTPGTWIQLAICLKPTVELIGDCGLHFPEGKDHEAEIGITLAPTHQGEGYASEALRAVLRYLFLTLDKRRVYGSTDPRNLPAKRIMESVGMRKEAHFRESLWFKGTWVDDVIYAMLRREWLERSRLENG